ncbi:MAG: precorrin-3B C(17)-methyltransferase [Pseudanabaenaceae cyanobacterium SKYGB_i_bin29]|nr:precorrin-3B C(17)-methyltransferase [Pseudanabaenaceae cyanobacterium SKYG29]MDW8420675.1 precorrin-3B C(17)-methyltransferase [Pseudanabaenaceae cyanobacterium SKYGB_i_bin29]
MRELAILVLGEGGIRIAQLLQSHYPSSKIYGWAKRVCFADIFFTEFAPTCQQLYRDGYSLVGICSAGILIRSLAPILQDKTIEPPVIALSEDGSTVVPLLGGLQGANELATVIAQILHTQPAITSTGSNRFKVSLLSPPQGYRLLNPIGEAKHFLADLLAGAKVKLNVSIDCPNPDWLTNSDLPISDNATHQITITTASKIDDLSHSHLAYQCTPLRGKLAVVGLGPGDVDKLTPAVQQIISGSTDIVGYHTYIKLLSKFTGHKTVHSFDNKQETDRAHLAIALAQQGKQVVVVSSGDAGIFGMATTVLEVLDKTDTDINFDLTFHPGISAVQTLAAKVGAPLGHDFAVISLSDHLKPWSTIADRLRALAQTDFVIAIYNPASSTRRSQIHQAKAILAQYRSPQNVVVVGKNLDRPGEEVIITTLQDFNPDLVDMQTIVLVGSSHTKIISKRNQVWVYTPRFYHSTGGEQDGQGGGAGGDDRERQF